MRVWRAERAEAATVARLIHEFGAWWGKPGAPEDELRASVERIVDGGDGEYLLGAPGGEAAGPSGAAGPSATATPSEAAGVCQLRFRWSVWTSAEDCWLEDLFVREDARRTGLGRALVEAALARARERGCKRIELDVNEDNAPALALYRACGFSLEPKGPGRTLFVGRPL